MKSWVMLGALMRKEVLALARDPHGLAALFLMPVLFVVVMSLALQDVYRPRLASLSYALDAREDTALAREFGRLWQQAHGAPKPLPVDWQEKLKAGELKYVLVVEAGFTKAFTALEGASAAPPLRLLAEPGIDANLFNVLRAELQAVAGPLRARTVIQVSGAPVDPSVADAPLATAERLGAGPRPTSVQQNVAAWLVFGMFFVVASLAGLFVEERQGGALARLRALGVPHAVLLASKALPYMGVNLMQAALMLAVGVWGLPALGGEALQLNAAQAPGLLFMVLATSVAAVALALALACAVRTHAQASAVGPVLNVLMGAVGGIMVPTFVMPPAMQALAAVSPMNWALEGLLAVLLREGGVGGALPFALRLAVLALVALALAWTVFRRTAR